jgi:phospholipid-binding lipoprotein MlaA
MKLYVISLVLLTFTICTPINVMAEEPHPASDEAERGTEPIGSQGDEELQYQDEDIDDLDEEVPTISDPIEPFNRAMFHFNDRLYFWVLRPVSLGYLLSPKRRG